MKVIKTGTENRKHREFEDKNCDREKSWIVFCNKCKAELKLEDNDQNFRLFWVDKDKAKGIAFVYCLCCGAEIIVE